ncbi:MAG: tRNA 4-thiouridine(8) synthase ThiI [Acholeplasmatales bacterium]|jgi:thiamine biosynthesis protein ThiI|nr:tRNA 4-thiouridine(8) synthase ThiI [Acholeplasmatales bacterium]
MNTIIVKFGDLSLKGKNIKVFLGLLYKHLSNKLKDLDLKIIKTHSWFTIEVNPQDQNACLQRLALIPGISSFYQVYTLPLDDELCASASAQIIDQYTGEQKLTIKFESKRINKSYPLNSLNYSIKMANLVLKKLTNKLIVDVHQPDFIANFQINHDNIYFYLSTNRLSGLGGFPYSVSGKGLVMLSGGIDSPVSAFLAMKQGLEIELFHFESTPLTPLESIQKVIDLAAVLANYTNNGQIKLHIVPINVLHQAILTNVKDSYIITILRRMMYRLASRFAEERGFDCLVNGESLGQVASQTINSLKTISAVCHDVILRPLITYDKNDIIKIARAIKTFEISIRSFNDCCSAYLPANPVIKPSQQWALLEEKRFNFEELLNKVYQDIVTIVIHENQPINICQYGIDFKEAFLNYEKNTKQ